MIGERGCQTRRMETAETKTIEVVVNGEPRRVPQGFSVDRSAASGWRSILRAWRWNSICAIVRKTDWPATRVEPGDRLEIVWFVGGG